MVPSFLGGTPGNLLRLLGLRVTSLLVILLPLHRWDLSSKLFTATILTGQSGLILTRRNTTVSSLMIHLILFQKRNITTSARFMVFRQSQPCVPSWSSILMVSLLEQRVASLYLAIWNNEHGQRLIVFHQ